MKIAFNIWRCSEHNIHKFCQCIYTTDFGLGRIAISISPIQQVVKWTFRHLSWLLIQRFTTRNGLRPRLHSPSPANFQLHHAAFGQWKVKVNMPRNGSTGEESRKVIWHICSRWALWSLAAWVPVWRECIGLWNTNILESVFFTTSNPPTCKRACTNNSHAQPSNLILPSLFWHWLLFAPGHAVQPGATVQSDSNIPLHVPYELWDELRLSWQRCTLRSNKTIHTEWASIFRDLGLYSELAMDF